MDVKGVIDQSTFWDRSTESEGLWISGRDTPIVLQCENASVGTAFIFSWLGQVMTTVQSIERHPEIL